MGRLARESTESFYELCDSPAPSPSVAEKRYPKSGVGGEDSSLSVTADVNEKRDIMINESSISKLMEWIVL